MKQLVISLVCLAIVVASVLYWDQYADAMALAETTANNSASIYNCITATADEIH